MQRVREGGGCQLIGFDAFQRIGGLERKTDVMKVERLQDPQMILDDIQKELTAPAVNT